MENSAIYTVCKGRVYLGSAGQGLSTHIMMLNAQKGPYTIYWQHRSRSTCASVHSDLSILCSWTYTKVYIDSVSGQWRPWFHGEIRKIAVLFSGKKASYMQLWEYLKKSLLVLIKIISVEVPVILGNHWYHFLMAYQSTECTKIHFHGAIRKNKPMSCWTWIIPAFANSVDPDQLASEEANWSGSTLFVIQYINLYQQSV